MRNYDRICLGGGLTAVMMNYYRMLWKVPEYVDKYHIDFCSQTACPDDALLTEIKAHGCKYHALPSRKKTPLKHLLALRGLVKEENYDIVHLNCNSATSTLDLLAIGNCAKRRITHVHTTQSQYPVVHKLLKPLFNRLYTDAIACTEDAGEWLYTRPYTVLNNAIDLDKFAYNESVRNQLRQEYGITDDDFVIGHVGKMYSTQKNQEYLISIFPEIQKKIPNAKLVLVGGGTRLEEYQCKAREMNLEDRIIFTGFHSNINDYVQMFDVFCFPSRFEGLGMAAVEAQASGLPAILSDQIPSDAAMTSNTTICGIDSENAKDWVSAILKYKTEEMPRSIRCEKAQSEITARGYNIANQLNELIKIYEGT